jgi:hypothetical protein
VLVLDGTCVLSRDGAVDDMTPKGDNLRITVYTGEDWGRND